MDARGCQNKAKVPFNGDHEPAVRAHTEGQNEVMMTLTPTEQLDTLLNVWEKLAPMERTTALAYLHRLYNGQKKFGPLKVGKKEWTYEALEEALDASVYLSSALAEHSMKAYQRMVGDAEKEVRNRPFAFVSPEDYEN